MASEFFTEKDNKILSLETRKKIYDLVHRNAGIYFREIERKSKFSTGHVQYHLSHLVRSGLLKEEKIGNHVRYFPRKFADDQKKMMNLLRQRSLRHLILFLLEHPSCHHQDLVKNMGLSPSTVSWHVKRLQQEKVMSCEKQGRNRIYRLLVDKKEITNLLIAYQESFFDSVVDNLIEMWEI